MQNLKTWLWTLVCGLLLAATIAIGQVREAELVVQETTDDLLELIEAAKAYVDEDPERFYAEVEALLDPVVDFPRFARSVMAAHYRDATPEQRERFATVFKSSLIRTYALALTEFSGDGDVRIIPSERPPRRPDRASVKQEIRSGTEIYPVIYSLAQSDDGQWRLRNIIINGINMGLTYRNQFASAVNDPQYGGDMDLAIDGWMSELRSTADANGAEGGEQAGTETAAPEGAAADQESAVVSAN